MMTREEMIKKLENAAFCAVPVMMTMDMGVQYDFITPEGAGSLFGTLGEWPAYCVQVVEESKWRRIREKVANGTVDEAEYCYDIQPWEEWSDKELAMWLQRTEGDLARFPFVGK